MRKITDRIGCQLSTPGRELKRGRGSEGIVSGRRSKCHLGGDPGKTRMPDRTGTREEEKKD